MNGVQISIQENVPIPTRTSGRRKYPWRDLKVGDSFMVRAEPGQDLKRLWNCLTSCRTAAERSTGWVFALRRVDFGIRAWRLE